jgi:hypothetical protein
MQQLLASCNAVRFFSRLFTREVLLMFWNQFNFFYHQARRLLASSIASQARQLLACQLLAILP